MVDGPRNFYLKTEAGVDQTGSKEGSGPGLVSVSRSKVARVQRHQAAQLLVAGLKYTDNFNINHETKCS